MVTYKINTLKDRISRGIGMKITYDISLNTRGITGKNKFFTVNVLSIWTHRRSYDSPWNVVIRVVGHPYGNRNDGKIDHEINSSTEETFFKVEEHAIEFTHEGKRIRIRLGDKQISQIHNALKETLNIAKECNQKLA
jgi:hypothetical protein